MIKLLHVFDKTLHVDFSGRNGQERLAELIEEMLSRIDVECLPCPLCGFRKAKWRLRYIRTDSFIWEDPDNTASVSVPVCQYFCQQCKTRGIETISTDVTIGKANLSYHYLFSLFRSKYHSAGKSIYELHNILYGKLSEESVKRWISRFQNDFAASCLSTHVSRDGFLSEQTAYGAFFQQFYISKGRCFMDDSWIKMIICDSGGKQCYIEKQPPSKK